MLVSRVRTTAAATTAFLALTLAASPAHAASPAKASPTKASPARTASGVDRGVLVPAAQQPPVGEAWKTTPYVNPYFEPGVTGPGCWPYGRATGAVDGLDARYDTSLWFYNYNDVWVFPDSAHAESFERQWKDLLTTCVERNKPGQGTETTQYVLDVTKIETVDDVDVWRLTTGVNGGGGTQHWQVALVRHGRAVYGMDMLDYRNGTPTPIPFASTIPVIKQKLAAYYP
ncbi:hypothetical protein [Actinomadura oligospora]|uniref:hypothetical protein n=1 Tax=Actinomadura oligospora TaxID=111804 RepID=UPI00047AC850|nr:hypothetical protein [Actinomadura oligospora]